MANDPEGAPFPAGGTEAICGKYGGKGGNTLDSAKSVSLVSFAPVVSFTVQPGFQSV